MLVRAGNRLTGFDFNDIVGPARPVGLASDQIHFPAADLRDLTDFIEMCFTLPQGLFGLLALGDIGDNDHPAGFACIGDVVGAGLDIDERSVLELVTPLTADLDMPLQGSRLVDNGFPLGLYLVQVLPSKEARPFRVPAQTIPLSSMSISWTMIVFSASIQS